MDVGAIVVERFQSHLGALEELSADSDLLLDLGLDSIGLVIILLDLADEFDLDLSSSRVTLADVNTLGDVVGLVRALLEESATNG
jgi:acyl carrier protein